MLEPHAEADIGHETSVKVIVVRTRENPTFLMKQTMTRCPHCDATCHPLRLLSSSNRKPYKCPECGRCSDFNKGHMAILVGISCGLGGGTAVHVLNHFGWIGLLVFYLLLAFSLATVKSLFLKLRPIGAAQTVSPDDSLPPPPRIEGY